MNPLRRLAKDSFEQLRPLLSMRAGAAYCDEPADPAMLDQIRAIILTRPGRTLTVALQNTDAPEHFSEPPRITAISNSGMYDRAILKPDGETTGK